MQARALTAIARLLCGYAPRGEADRILLQPRIEVSDWIGGDKIRIREMLPAALRLLPPTNEADGC